jgi:hypothetical protein
MRAKGIFCLEGLWVQNLKDKSTVGPILDLLDESERIPHIHRDCAATAEIEYYIGKWTLSTYRRFPILYFAFHGVPGAIYVGNWQKLSLEELAAFFPRPKRSVIIFGSCKTVAVRKARLKAFMKRTGAIAVCGYETDVDWIRSTAFELLLLNTLQQNEFSGKGISAIVRKTKAEARRFKELGFRIIPAFESANGSRKRVNGAAASGKARSSATRRKRQSPAARKPAVRMPGSRKPAVGKSARRKTAVHS